MIVGLLFTPVKTSHGRSQLDIDQCSDPLVMMIVMVERIL